jgi:TetR/AcrR family transcriptional repressor of nem operon
MARPPGTGSATTKDHILDVAQHFAQTRGFNGFSYAHIAAEIGITTASLHYHFASKTDLGRALVARYARNFQAALAGISAREVDAAEKLRRYVRVYREVLGAGRMCLCGMFAAEYATLPEPVQAELRSFFDENEAWLVGVLEEGRRRGELEFEGAARDMAGLLTGALEGSMLIARSYGDGDRFTAPAEQLLKAITPRRGAALVWKPPRGPGSTAKGRMRVPSGAEESSSSRVPARLLDNTTVRQSRGALFQKRG